jgi:hypothetical protein
VLDLLLHVHLDDEARATVTRRLYPFIHYLASSRRRERVHQTSQVELDVPSFTRVSASPDRRRCYRMGLNKTHCPFRVPIKTAFTCSCAAAARGIDLHENVAAVVLNVAASGIRFRAESDAPNTSDSGAMLSRPLFPEPRPLASRSLHPPLRTITSFHVCRRTGERGGRAV